MTNEFQWKDVDVVQCFL